MNEQSSETQEASNHSAEEELNSFKLDVYIVDAGWDSLAHRVLNESMELIKSYLRDQNLFILSPEQSVKFLRSHPDLVGRDPIVIIVDRLARKLQNPDGFGARIGLGLIENEYELHNLIKMFLTVINKHESTLDIANTFRKYNHQEGMNGAIDIIMESFSRGGHH